MSHNYVNKLTTLEPSDYVYKNIFEFKEKHKIKNDIIEKIWKENFSSNKSKCPNCNIYPICKPFSSGKQGVHGKFTPHSLIVKKKNLIHRVLKILHLYVMYVIMNTYL